MKKLALALILTVSLSGCANTNWGAITQGVGAVYNAQITQNQLDAARATYVAAFLVPATHYRRLGICKAGVSSTLAAPCADRAKVLKLQQLDQTAQMNFDRVQALVNQGDSGQGLPTAWAALQVAISTAQAAL